MGWGPRRGVSLRVGRADGRGQVRGGDGAGAIWDQAQRLEVSEGAGQAGVPAPSKPLPCPPVLVWAPPRWRCDLGSSPHRQGDLGQVAATGWASVSPPVLWGGGGGGPGKSRSLEAAQRRRRG